MAHLTTFRLVLINAMVCGLEVAATVAFTYLPPILLKAGFTESTMGIILGIGPFIGMLTVSSVGQLSDYWNAKYGHRLYFILMFAILLSLSLLAIIIGHRLSRTSEGLLVGCFFLAIGGVVLDYSSQVGLNPCESMLSDLLQGSSESLEEHGFSIYSGVLSLGGCVGYLVTGVHWPWGYQEEAACTAALVLFLLCCTTTTLAVSSFSTKRTSISGRSTRRRVLSWGRLDIPWKICTLPRIIARRTLAAIAFLYQKVLLLPVSVWREVQSCPLLLWKLFVADTISWAAFSSHSLFYAHYVGQVVFGGHPNAPAKSLEEDLYTEGLRMGSWGLLLHSMSACGYVLLLQGQLITAYGLKQTYMFGLASFSVCMFLSLAVRDVWLLNLLSAFSGVGFAVMTSIPSALLTIYHSNQEAFYFDMPEGHRRGSGADFGILYVGYYLGQTLLSLVMSNVVQALGLPHCYIAFAGLGSLVSCFFANKVVFSVSEIPSLRAVHFGS